MMNTLLFLMEPDGYPALTDNFTNGYKNYAIQDILFDKHIDRERLVVVSTQLRTDRYKEIKLLMENFGYNWLEISKDTNLSQLKHDLDKNYKFDLNIENTNIIYGGTNTSHEVLHSEKLSLSRFASEKFYCQLYLPLCADIVMPGVFQIDKDMKAFSQVYQFIKRNNYLDTIDILTRFGDLKLPWRNRDNV